MNIKIRSFTHSFIVMLMTVVIAQAQAGDQLSLKADDGKAPESTITEVERLKSEMEKLQMVVEQQRQLLLEMQKRLVMMEASLPQKTSAPNDKSVVANATASQTPSLGDGTTVTKPPSAQEKPPAVAGWDKNHAFLRSADGAFETTIGGYAQLDFRGYASGNHPPNTFLIRRARLILEGRLHRYYDYKIEGDFSDTNNTILRDGFVRIHRIEALQLTFGQFRVPISQEEIRSDNTQDFIERSLVNNLVPSRSPGLMASGVISRGKFAYQVGAFNGKGLLAGNNSGTPEIALRLRFSPWKQEKIFLAKGLSFGGAITQGRNVNGQSVRGQTESRSFTFFAPETVNGKYTRANAELTWLLGSAAFRAEYVQTHQQRQSLGAGGTNLPGVIAKGYMAQFTYLLTGEAKPEAATVTPKRELFSNENGRRGLGAFELKFRYANLQIADGTPRSNRAETIFFGPNWYLNRFARYLLDLGFERYKDPSRSPSPHDKNFFVVLSRLQFTL
ncbi:MAG: porin [Acidobacteriota bacterium]